MFTENNQTLLRQAFEQQREQKEQVNAKIGKMQSMKMSEDEKRVSDTIILSVSEAFKDKISESGITDAVSVQITRYVTEKLSTIEDYETQQRLKKIILNTLLGYGPIDAFIKDPNVEDIIVQRFDNIVIVKKGIRYNTEAEFQDDDALITVINRIVHRVGRQINQLSPKVDARLPDGSRINATIPPISPNGATLTIRKFKNEGFTIDDYIKYGTMDRRIADFLVNAVKSRANILIGGGTGSGKTTLLTTLGNNGIRKDELVITIEDSCEISLNHKNLRSLEARVLSSGDAAQITIQELVKNALRMTVDRIIVGEARDGVVVDLFSAMSTGHDGSMSTIHCNNPENMVNSRIPILYSMYKDGEFTREGQTIQIAEAVDLIVHISRITGGEQKGKRVITHVTAVEGLDERNGKVILKDIYRYDMLNQKFYATGYVPVKILGKMEEHGIDPGGTAVELFPDETATVADAVEQKR